VATPELYHLYYIIIILYTYGSMGYAGTLRSLVPASADTVHENTFSLSSDIRYCILSFDIHAGRCSQKYNMFQIFQYTMKSG